MISERQMRTYVAAVTGAGQSDGEDSPEPAMNPNSTPMTEDLQNPFYLHFSESSNAVLVSPPLTENNYESWSRSMKMALEIKNKLGLIDGSIVAPMQNDPQFHAWRRCNMMICSWILRSVSPSIVESILYLDIAKDMWTDLSKRFSQSDPHRIAELQNQIFNMKQHNMSVTEYYTKSIALWENMNVLRPLPMCECIPRCSCTLISKIRKEREDDCVIRFVEGLKEDYETVKSNVLVMDPIPVVDRVFKMALKLERKLNESAGKISSEMMHVNAGIGTQIESNDDESVIAAVGGTSSGYANRRKFNGKNVPKCTFCGMLGHTIEKCYKKHGYPPGWVPGYKNKPNHTQGGKQNQNSQGGTGHSINQVGECGLSADQFQKLISLIQNNNPGQNSSSVASVISNTSNLMSDFKGNHNQSNEGPSWDDAWFC